MELDEADASHAVATVALKVRKDHNNVLLVREEVWSIVFAALAALCRVMCVMAANLLNGFFKCSFPSKWRGNSF